VVMDDLVAVTCLRHGLTWKNTKKAYVGWTDPPLIEKEKSRLRASVSCYPEVDLVMSSDLIRCLETAMILYPTLTRVIESGYRELNFGDWEGKTYNMLKSCPRYTKWLDDPLEISPPNGETYGSFASRVQESWLKTVSRFEKTNLRHIVIVSHGGPIRLLLERYAPDAKPFWRWKIEPGSGYTLAGKREQVRGGGRCTSLQAVPITENGNG
jgi:alpha-ribazole phosphatase